MFMWGDEHFTLKFPYLAVECKHIGKINRKNEVCFFTSLHEENKRCLVSS